VEIGRWGRDHWSLLLYLETRCVDHRGEIDLRHMRCDSDRHPGLAVNHPPLGMDKKYPTRLVDGVELHDHDDHDCFYDLEEAGLISDIGTGIHPVARMTESGSKLAAELRAWRAAGKSTSAFKPSEK